MGPLKPLRQEMDVAQCRVRRGEIPKTLHGGFYRCGPAWKRPQKQGCLGFLSMDGMITAMLFENGKASFRNKWVRTPKYLVEEKYDESLFEYADGTPSWWGYGVIDPKPDPRAQSVPSGTPWINAVPFAGKHILALGELNTVPYVIDPISLDTRGIVPWASQCGPGLIERRQAAEGAFCPHPKWDTQTGEMFAWSATDREPYARILVIKPDGSVKSRDLDRGRGLWPSNLHDGWLTKDYLVLGFEQFINTRERARNGLPVLGWDEDGGIKLALIPRSLEGEIHYIDAPFRKQGFNHTAGTNTFGNQIQLDAPLFEKVPFPFEQDMAPDGQFPPFKAGYIGRWTVDLDERTVRSEVLGDRNVEEPKIDDRYHGRNYQYAFLMSGPTYFSFDTLIKRDMLTGHEEAWTLKRDMPFAMFESVFIPRSDNAPEADGHLIVPVSRYGEGMTDYLIFDTTHIAAGPIAEIELPFQIGWGPHGNWLDLSRTLPGG
jgi:carotenoid cleavage dioxygenase